MLVIYNIYIDRSKVNNHYILWFNKKRRGELMRRKLKDWTFFDRFEPNLQSDTLDTWNAAINGWVSWHNQNLSRKGSCCGNGYDSVNMKASIFLRYLNLQNSAIFLFLQVVLFLFAKSFLPVHLLLLKLNLQRKGPWWSLNWFWHCIVRPERLCAPS